MRVSSFVVISFLLSINIVFSGGVYTWQDKDGVTHFGDRPQYQDTKKVKVDKNFKVDQHAVNRLKRLQKSNKIAQEDYKQAQVDAALMKKKSAETASKCIKVKKMQTGYARARLLYKKDEKGERQYLNGEEKTKAMAELASYLEKHCQ